MNVPRNADYHYLAVRTMGDKKVYKEKVVKGTQPKTDSGEATLRSIDLMMKRLYKGTSAKQLAAESGYTPGSVDGKLTEARKLGVPEVAREIFIKEFLPASMARLQEALVGEDLKLAVQVALKVVAGLEIMNDPDKAPAPPQGEPESFEAFRMKFTKKPTAVEGVVIKQLPPASDDPDQSNNYDPRASVGIRKDNYGQCDPIEQGFDPEDSVSEDAEEECGEIDEP